MNLSITPITATAELTVFSPEGIQYVTQVRIKGSRTSTESGSYVTLEGLEDALTGESVTGTMDTRDRAIELLEQVQADQVAA
jgi:hypothetical protein